jgi:NTE family protein
VEPLKQHCDTIIGVYINSLQKISIKDLNHSYNVADRALKIRAVSDSIRKFPECDLVIAPKDVGGFAIFGMSNTDAIFEMGYSEAMAALKENENLFKN